MSAGRVSAQARARKAMVALGYTEASCFRVVASAIEAAERAIAEESVKTRDALADALEALLARMDTRDLVAGREREIDVAAAALRAAGRLP